MALSNSEANAVNTVARYFLGIPNHAGPIGDEQALRALQLLRDKAYKTLMAGLTDAEIREAFERHQANRARHKVEVS